MNTNKNKLAVITSSISRKGGGLYETIRGLNTHLSVYEDIDIQIFTLEDEYSFVDIEKYKPIKVSVYKIKGPKYFGYCWKYLQNVNNYKPDIMHSQGLWMFPSIVEYLMGRKYSIPYVISPQGMLDGWALKNSKYKKLIALLFYEKAHLRYAGCLHAIREREYYDIRKLGISNPVCVIPNGVTLPSLENLPEPPWKNMIEQGRKILVYLGRYHHKKNLINLIKAWKLVTKKKNNQWLLVFAGCDGGDGYEEKMKMVAAEQNIEYIDITKEKENEKSRNIDIIFVGPQYHEKNTSVLYHSNAFILPSLSEGLPIAVLQAWTCEKPVVMTKECNLEEGFKERAAIQIETNVKSIAHGLNVLFELSDNDIKNIGKMGRQLVEKKFSWPIVATQMKSVYDWLLGGGSPPSCVIKD